MGPGSAGKGTRSGPGGVTGAGAAGDRKASYRRADAAGWPVLSMLTGMETTVPSAALAWTSIAAEAAAFAGDRPQPPLRAAATRIGPIHFRLMRVVIIALGVMLFLSHHFSIKCSARRQSR